MNTKLTAALLAAILGAATGPAQPPAAGRSGTDKVTFHNDAARTGWNAQERVLTPAVVAGPRFGQVWQSPALDGFGDNPARLFASPLYLAATEITGGVAAGRTLPVVFAASSTGYVYAISASASGPIAAGAILWRARLTDHPCDDGESGILSTPVIDRAATRIYVTSCDSVGKTALHALDLRSGAPIAGWPIPLNAAAINAPDVTRNNGGNRFTDARTIIQRGALNLSADGKRLYVAIGPDSTGWLVAVDTTTAKVASAFSSTATADEDQGGMWAAAGPSIDAQGRIQIATGSKFLARARVGVAGIFPDSAHNWGQSLLQFRDDPKSGLVLIATYSPFNYCQAGSNDIDLGASGVIAFDLPAGTATTTNLLAIGGKQGNFYLLDRDRLPGDTNKRHACGFDPDADGSLLAPDPQPHLGLRGPINLFGPYSDYVSMLDQAKSRSTPAVYRDATGTTFAYATGSAKSGDDFATSVPPGLARVSIVAEKGKPAYPRLDILEKTQTFQNPGSPVISSNGGNGAIVWVLDMNAPRSASLYGPEAPKPILYAFDAAKLKLLWKNKPGVLQPSGKYNEPTIVDGLVLVGTDRIQAFGLRNVATTGAAVARPTAAGPAAKKPVVRAVPPAVTRKPAAVTAPAPAAASGDLLAGQRVFRARCAACHEAGQPGTPSRAALARMPRTRIEAALISGVMRPMATGMSKSDVASVARFLVEAKR